MHAEFSMRRMRILTILLPLFILAACGQGDGPTPIPGTPATPMPPGGGGGPAFDSGLLTNGDFEAGVAPWIGNAANVIDEGGNLVNFADIAVAGDSFNVNLSQVVAITQGETYTLTFKARSNRNRTIEAGIGLNEAPWDNTKEIANLTPDWQTFQYVLTAGFGNANSRVLFDMGAEIGQVIIDDVSLFLTNDEGGGGGPINPDFTLFSSSGAADLVIPDDYAERTPFGSGSVIVDPYVDDATYSPVLSVFSGAGYGANVAQVGFIGFRPGFLGAYATVDFKVKGMPNFVVFVKLFDGIDALRINLTSSSYSSDLGDGWYQVSIPVSRFANVGMATGIVFESDNTSPAQFQMLMTDIGFSGVGDNPPEIPGSGIMPEAVVYASDQNVVEDLVPPGGIQNFGSGAVFDEDYAGDFDFNPALQVISGEGYGPGVHVGFAAFTGYAAGFASTYETLYFKVKADAANLGAFEVKLIGNGDTSRVYDLTTYAGATDLGAGWLQVSIPMTEFAATVANNDGFLLGPYDNQGAAFSFLLTDIGFSGTLVDPGIMPEAVAYSSDPAVAEDLGPPGGIQNYGSGAGFVDILDDPDFAKVLETTSGEDYGPGVHVGFAAFTGYAAGFAAGYETFHFKVKGDAANLGAFEVKLTGGGLDTGKVYDLGSYAGVTSLGKGWLQVSVPMTEFAATVADNDGFLLGPYDNQGAAFTFLMTDIGFSGTVGPGAGDELLVNGDFEASAADKTGWIGAGVVVTDNYYTAEQAVPGQPAFTVNLSQVLTITPAADYVLTFRAKASVDRGMLAGIGLNEDPWSAATVTVPLTTEWQSFSYPVSAINDADGVPFGNDNSRVLFDMGAEVGVVNIDDVSLSLAGGN